MSKKSASLPLFPQAETPPDQPTTPQSLSAPLPEQVIAALRLAHEHFQFGRFADAVKEYDTALSITGELPSAWSNRGAALRRLGKPEEALASYWRSIQVGGPDTGAAWLNAANILLDANRLSEAQAALHSAVRQLPQDANVWVALAALASRRNQDAASESCLRRAAALAPRDATPLIRLAAQLSQHSRLEEAEELYAKARALAPLNATAHSGYAQTLVSQGRLEEAEPHFRRALELDADHLDAHLGLARLLLLKGDLIPGWVEYEWRRRKDESKLPKMSGPEWDGSSLAGKTLLVYCEQGFGDSLQFIRYIPQLAQQGAKIILATTPPLERLFSTVPGIAQIVTRPQALPPYDFHIPLLSVPRFMGVSMDNIPAPIPYLQAPPGQPLPLPLGTRLRVGIVWAGSPQHANDRNRSLRIDDFMPLAQISGVTLYSLQTGPQTGDIIKQGAAAVVVDLSSRIKDFADTASIIDQLDLVICVDTAIAHLAGALGKPVWVLTSFAPDWRWVLGRDDTPWYPTLRLFRQPRPRAWTDVIDRVKSELSVLVRQRPLLGLDGDAVFDTLMTGPDGKPRFRMWVPRAMLTDAGLSYLALRENSGAAYEYATRSFIDHHLRPDDLFLDVGAHWGIMSLQAATRWPGQVKVLACEPDAVNLTHLHRWIDGNKLSDQIEVIGAAIADKPGHGSLKPESTMGYSLIRDEQDSGGIPVATIDQLLADRPDLQKRRVILKIDVEGWETEVVDGMADLLASGRVAAVIWERGHTYDFPENQDKIANLRARFAALGFTAWMFEGEDQAGALIPFVDRKGWLGNIFELAPGETPAPSYGGPRLSQPPQPVDPVLYAWNQANLLVRQGGALQSANQMSKAIAHYIQAAHMETRVPDLWNNLGVALRNLGLFPAAEACYHRSVALRPYNASGRSNLGNLLREVGRLEEAEAMHQSAAARAPRNPQILYNWALVARDDGRPEDSYKLFERVLEIDPNNSECLWDKALSMLQQGDYARGWPAYESRWGLKRSPPRTVPLPRWNGEPLEGRSLFLHDEQGFGDVLEWARFIAQAKQKGAGRIVLECQPELLRLMRLAPHVDEVIPRGAPTPKCDVYAPLLSLPGLFGTTLENLPNQVPYLQAPPLAMPLPPTSNRLRLGLVWAGKPTPRDRSCPLDRILPVLGDPRFAINSLQVGPRAVDLKRMGGDSFIDDLGPRLTDFAETAAAMQQLDALVTIDTSVAHLAGALGVPTFLLLLYTSDWRWFDRGEDSPWYPTMRIFRQPKPGEWDQPLSQLSRALDDFASKRTAPLPGLLHLR